MRIIGNPRNHPQPEVLVREVRVQADDALHQRRGSHLLDDRGVVALARTDSHNPIRHAD